MLEPLILREQLLALLVDHLGTYTFSDGFQDVAIAVFPNPESGYEYPLPGTKTDGLEVIIVRPVPEITPLLGAGIVKTYRWEIILKQWDSSKDLMLAIEALFDGLPHLVKSPVHAPPNASLGIIEQAKFEIVEYEYQEIAE